jgi:hypothetical protein
MAVRPALVHVYKEADATDDHPQIILKIGTHILSSNEASSSGESDEESSASESTAVDGSGESPEAFFGHQMDFLAYIPHLTGLTAMSSILGTLLWACNHPRIDCQSTYPSLSTAAQFQPQLHLFMAGMVITSFLLLTTMGLFHWYLRLIHCPRRWTSAVFVSGVWMSIALFALALCDARSHHMAHVTTSIVFCTNAWSMIVLIAMIRRHISVKASSQRNAAWANLYMTVGAIAFLTCKK